MYEVIHLFSTCTFSVVPSGSSKLIQAELIKSLGVLLDPPLILAVRQARSVANTAVFLFPLTGLHPFHGSLWGWSTVTCCTCSCLWKQFGSYNFWKMWWTVDWLVHWLQYWCWLVLLAGAGYNFIVFVKWLKGAPGEVVYTFSKSINIVSLCTLISFRGKLCIHLFICPIFFPYPSSKGLQGGTQHPVGWIIGLFFSTGPASKTCAANYMHLYSMEQV